MLLFVASFTYVAHFLRRTQARMNHDSEKPSVIPAAASGTDPSQGQGYAQRPADYPQQAIPAQYVQNQPYDPVSSNRIPPGMPGLAATMPRVKPSSIISSRCITHSERRLLVNIINHLRIISA
ncbi:hypothetical protein DL766_004995 [Monosporascus sp. MC13-8B]|uniref:Uncharacterized protein n=1 Tax=Monosporascus cannonballus TaxID=155416 RepID=A0ABY0HCY0_9PEZI|nr:hypothetical protein DL762_004128 [Monosporascus cannonballus]RYO94349.1 hypothetical protein DL763_004065 [Monosporascus cannonballus]RYP30167.1 hypothetical protein DL766_004995 [Monosporascus sp. MC13-8B]